MLVNVNVRKMSKGKNVIIVRVRFLGSLLVRPVFVTTKVVLTAPLALLMMANAPVVKSMQESSVNNAMMGITRMPLELAYKVQFISLIHTSELLLIHVFQVTRRFSWSLESPGWMERYLKS